VRADDENPWGVRQIAPPRRGEWVNGLGIHARTV
jgi:hypothetical protein